MPVRPATEIRLVTWLTDAVDVPQGAEVARVSARLASGRAFDLPLRAGVDTAEWAHDRPDVSARMAHRRASVAQSFRAPEGTFLGHHYQAVLRLPGRYYVDGVRLERLGGPGRLMVSRLELVDTLTQRVTPVSPASAYVSDGSRLRETAATPGLRLYELPAMQLVRVVGKLRVMPTEQAVARALDLLPQIGLDPLREAVVAAEDAGEIVLPPRARSSKADLARSEPDRLDVRAEGPGLLVVAEAWDPGWSAQLDGRPARVHRVNLAQIGVVLAEGTHHVRLRYRPRGLVPGLVLAATGGLVLALAAARRRF